ncbi:hypothetical protein N7468_010432 [Penicillium chermesinum]|uniref:Uncharacterized protein n=1 Tax=Penicillium chermesinum TaxID=63820 RepID=A0A9W9NCS4_9EURO|nr:uncharacterized protein N7468_010432 [Penicillium chermesinum]KAJ5217424.1 hypothetical protein N7468_010432 [Penicillium chermesinum]KAJ6170966.1 hypothetical protein N7470_000033 [Penicillium chermesinum]
MAKCSRRSIGFPANTSPARAERRKPTSRSAFRRPQCSPYFEPGDHLAREKKTQILNHACLRIAHTLGDPAGFGPGLAARLIADPRDTARARIHVLADRSEVRDTATIGSFVQDLEIFADGTAPIEVGKFSKGAGARVLHQAENTHYIW